MTELLAKYQKLATEFSKVRAQVVVLKKAVIDEQATNSDLKDKLRSSEQTTRKLEQEVEGVSFRNQQLESRVLVLQAEIEQLSGKRKKSSTNTTTSTQLDILNEELSNKLNENVRLHIKLNQSEGQFRTEVETIKSKLQDVEHDLENSQSHLKDSERRLKTVQSELRDSSEEASVNLSRVRDLEKKLIESQSKMEEFETRSTFNMATALSETEALKKELEEERRRCTQIEGQRLEERKEFKGEMEWRDKMVEELREQTQTTTTTKPSTETTATQTNLANIHSSTTQTTMPLQTSSSTQSTAITTTSTTTQTTHATTSTTTQTTIQQQQQNDNSDKSSLSSSDLQTTIIDTETLLQNKISSLQSTLMETERGKEHWHLQAQLESARYKHQVQVNNQTTTLPRNKTSVDASKEEDEDISRVCGLTLKSDLADIKVTGAVQNAPRTEGDLVWDEERERIIVQYFEERLHRGVVGLQEVQASSNHYEMETKALTQQLTYLTHERDRLLVDLDRTNQSMAQLKDELNTTSSNYESQLSLMSEHLAGINEKMVDQKEEIDALHFQLHTPSHQNNTNNNNSIKNNNNNNKRTGNQSKGVSRLGRL